MGEERRAMGRKDFEMYGKSWDLWNILGTDAYAFILLTRLHIRDDNKRRLACMRSSGMWQCTG